MGLSGATLDLDATNRVTVPDSVVNLKLTAPAYAVFDASLKPCSSVDNMSPAVLSR